MTESPIANGCIVWHTPMIEEELVGAIAAAIENELMRQSEGDCEQGMLQASLGMLDFQKAAQAAIEAIGLEKEVRTNVPISVNDYDDDGNPIMDERLLIPTPKSHFEWATKEHWITSWVETGREPFGGSSS